MLYLEIVKPADTSFQSDGWGWADQMDKYVGDRVQADQLFDYSPYGYVIRYDQWNFSYNHEWLRFVRVND